MTTCALGWQLHSWLWIPQILITRSYFVSPTTITRTDPRPAVRPAEGPNSFHWKNVLEVGSFILLHKILRTACCLGKRIILKLYNCYESVTIWYTDHQYLSQYSEIINNLQEISFIFCNYVVRSRGTWHKGPGQSPCNVMSISDLELYVNRSGVTLDLRTYVHLGRACRFTYAVRWSGIPIKFRHGLTYFHFPVLIWKGNAIRSSRWIE